MNKELLEEMAMLYALGTLPDGEVESFEARMREDRWLQELVHQSQLLNELEVAECAQAEPPFHAYSRIMAAIDASKGEPVPFPAPKGKGRPASSAVQRGSFVSWGGWAAAACAALLFAWTAFDSSSSLAPMGNQLAAGPAAGSDIILNNLANPSLVSVRPPSEDYSKEDRLLELSALTEAYWFSREGIPSDQLLEDEGIEAEKLTGGFTVFDREYGIGFIAVENLPHEIEGNSYHVWARTKDGSKPVRAGSLPIGEDSRGLFFFDLSEVPEVARHESVDFFVTEERVSNPDGPNGSVVLSSYQR